MNPPLASNQPDPQAVSPARDRRPLKLLLAIVGILTARWIWIAGLGDYAWTYELGMRVGQGEVPFRDFICTLPQLTSYTIVPFLVLLKGNLWAFSLHLYAWWFATLFVGLQVARALGLRPAAQIAAMFFAACVSLPATHLGHAYSYAGTFFFGLTLLQLHQFRKRESLKSLLLAGVFAGLGIFAKQNIGILAVLLGVGMIAYDCILQKQIGRMFRPVLVFCSGAALAFLPIFAFFASKAGASEVFQQMFSDAGAGKGGMFGMLFHALPLFFFSTETPARQLWTLAFSGVVVMAFFGFVGFKMQRLQASPVADSPSKNAKDHWQLIACAVALVALLSAVSLFDMPSVRDGFNKLHPKAVYEFHGFVAPLNFIAYTFFTALAAICLLSPAHWLQKDLFLPIVGLPLVLWGHELSCQGYLPFGAPLVVPLAFVLLEKIGIIRNTVPLGCIAGIILMIGVTGSTQPGYQPPSFKSVERLPSESKFTGLWANPVFAATTKELHKNVAPKIRDHTTLWLTIGGPHLAYGGKSVFNVAALFGDTYNLRSEPALLARWQAQPPQFIFVGDRNLCPGSQVFTTESLNLWLPQRYDPVWKSSERDATLWGLRSQTNNPSR